MQSRAHENLRHWLSGKPLNDALAELADTQPPALVQSILNTRLNEWCRENADGKDRWGEGQAGLLQALMTNNGKALPYVGWYWRSVDWFGAGGIPVADCGEFIGHCENNKWGYDQRDLTGEEAVEIRDLIWDAMTLEGNLHHHDEKVRGEREAAFAAHLEKIWEWYQTLRIPPSPWRI